MGSRDREPIRAQDPAALAAFSTQFMPALRAFFSRRAQSSEVEDLVQETLYRIQRRSSSTVIENLEGYIFQVAANVLTDAHRRDRSRERGSQIELTENFHPVDEMSPERVLLGRQAMASVVVALKELPERTRHVFILVRFEEMSYKRVAQNLGISVSAVEKHVMKALKHLNARLRE